MADFYAQQFRQGRSWLDGKELFEDLSPNGYPVANQRRLHGPQMINFNPEYETAQPCPIFSLGMSKPEQQATSTPSLTDART